MNEKQIDIRNRPFIFLNAAVSADGKISTKERRQIKISGDCDLERVDELKKDSDAIMVGIGTVLADDPSLTIKSETRRNYRKDEGLDENPVRIIVDSRARTPKNADILKKGKGKRIIAVSKSAPKEKLKILEDKATVIVAGDGKVDLKMLAEKLKEMGIEKIMVEGGSSLNWSLLSLKLVDEIYTFIGNIIIGGYSAPTLVDGSGFLENEILQLKLANFEQMDKGLLVKWQVVYKDTSDSK